MITIDIGLTSAEVRNPSELRREPFTTGTVGREVLLVFSGEWSGLAKTAVFIGSDDTRDVLITGTALSAVVVVPHEVLVKPCGELTLGVYGTNGDTIAIPTVYTSLGMIRQGADPSGDPSTDPSLPVWAQVQAEQQRQAAAIENRIKKFYATGTEGNIPDSDDGTLRALKVYGNSVQDGTPTPDHPIAIRSVVNPVAESVGKNLIEPTLPTTSKFGVTCTNNGDGTYTINGTCSVNNYTDFYLNQPFENVHYKPNTQYKLAFVKDRLPTGILTGLRKDGAGANILDNGSGVIIANLATNDYHAFIRVSDGAVCNNITIKPMLTEDLNATFADYQPYQSTSAPIPGITLRKVDDVADYVDVERGVVVRRIKDVDMGDLTYGLNGVIGGGHERVIADVSDVRKATSNNEIAKAICEIYAAATPNETYAHTVDKTFSIDMTGAFVACDSSIDFSSYTWASDYKELVRGKHLICILLTPTEEPIPADILAQLRAIKSYYPQTNVSVTSDEVDGAASFLYPVSIEKFVEYTKQQMGDTRVFIYDLQDIADNAYINAEYATVLAEFALDDF